MATNATSSGLQPQRFHQPTTQTNRRRTDSVSSSGQDANGRNQSMTSITSSPSHSMTMNTLSKLNLRSDGHPNLNLPPPSSTSQTVSHQSQSSANGSLMPPSSANNNNTGSGNSSSAADQSRPRSSSSSKALLTMALLEAQSAVQLDNASEVSAALEAYRRAVDLLGKVMEASSSEDEQDRLRTIHDSYIFRIRLLSTPPSVPPPTSSESEDQPPQSQSAHTHTQTQIKQTSGPIQGILDTPPPPLPLPSLPTVADSESVQTPPRRQKKAPAPLKPSALAAAAGSSQQMYPEPKTPRRAAAAAAAAAASSAIAAADDWQNTRPLSPLPQQPTTPGLPLTPKNHARTFSSSPRTGDIISAAEQMQLQAQQRSMPKSRSKEQLSGPLHPAPTAPLPPPPTPITSGPLPALPTGATLDSGSLGAPPGANAATNFAFLSSLPNGAPSNTLISSSNPLPTPPPQNQPPKTPTASSFAALPFVLSSPPPSPANTRRTSPLVPVGTSSALQNMYGSRNGSLTSASTSALKYQQQQQPSGGRRPLSPTEPQETYDSAYNQQQEQTYGQQHHTSNNHNTSHSNHHHPQPQQQHQYSANDSTPTSRPIDFEKFYDDEDLAVADQWLPGMSSSTNPRDYSSNSEVSLDQYSADPYPRERVASKGSMSSLDQLPQSQGQYGNGELTHQASSTSIGSSSTAGSAAAVGGGFQHHQRSSSQNQGFNFANSSRSIYGAPGGSNSVASLNAQLSQLSHQQQQQQQMLLQQHQNPYAQDAMGSQPTSHLQHQYLHQQHLYSNLGNSKRASDSGRSVNSVDSTMGGGSAGGSIGPSLSQNGVNASSVTLVQPVNESQALALFRNFGIQVSATSPTASSGSRPGLTSKASISTIGSYMNGSASSNLYDVVAEDPFAGLLFPLPPPLIEPPPTDTYFRCFWLMRRLEQSMTMGGFVSKRLYVPRSLWFQSSVRVPAFDSKVSACQTVTTILNKIQTMGKRGQLNLMVEAGGGQKGDDERNAILSELDSLERIVVQIQSKMSKKLSFVQRPGKNGGGSTLTLQTNAQGNIAIAGNGSTPTTGGQQQQMMQGMSGYEEQEGIVVGAGGGAFDWMNHSNEGSSSMVMSSGASMHSAPSIHESSMVGGMGSSSGSKKMAVQIGGSQSNGSGQTGDITAGNNNSSGLKGSWKNFSKSVQKSMANDRVEDMRSYTETMVRLFQSTAFLEGMLKHYNGLTPFQTHVLIVNRLRRICDFLSMVVCAFVIRDLGELMGKYVKRVATWTTD